MFTSAEAQKKYDSAMSIYPKESFEWWFARAMLANEAPYEAMYRITQPQPKAGKGPKGRTLEDAIKALGNSGTSFGPPQWDLGQGREDGVSAMKLILTNAKDPQGNLIVENPAVLLRKMEAFRSKRYSATVLNDNETVMVNRALQSDFGVEKINSTYVEMIASYKKLVQKVATEINDSTNRNIFLSNLEMQVEVADTINQHGKDGSDKIWSGYFNGLKSGTLNWPDMATIAKKTDKGLYKIRVQHIEELFDNKGILNVTKHASAPRSATVKKILVDTPAKRSVNAISISLDTITTSTGPTSFYLQETEDKNFSQKILAPAGSNGLLVCLDPNSAEPFSTKNFLDAISRSDAANQLTALDVNGDGVIDSTDSGWGYLGVWSNLITADGTVTPQFFSMNDLGVSSISIENGNAACHFGDGSVQQLTNVSMVSSPIDTEQTSAIEIPTELLALPDIPATGTMANLREKMAADGILEALVKSICSINDVEAITAAVDKLLLVWSDNATVTQGYSDGIDNRKLSVINSFRGAALSDAEVSALGAAAPQLISNYYDGIRTYVMASILAQAQLAQFWPTGAFQVGASLDASPVSPDYGLFSQTFESLRLTSPGIAANRLAMFAITINGFGLKADAGYTDFKTIVTQESADFGTILNYFDGTLSSNKVVLGADSASTIISEKTFGELLLGFSDGDSFRSGGFNRIEELNANAAATYEVSNGDVVLSGNAKSRVWFLGEELTGGAWNTITQQFESADFSYKAGGDNPNSVIVTSLKDPTQSITLQNVPILQNADGTFSLSSPYLGLDLFTGAAITTIDVTMGDKNPYSVDTTITPYDFWMTWASGFSDRVNIVEPGGRYNLRITDLSSSAILTNGILDPHKALDAITSRVQIRDFQVEGNGNVLENIIFSDGVVVPVGSILEAPQVGLPDQAVVQITNSTTGSVAAKGLSNNYVLGANTGNVTIANFQAYDSNVDALSFTADVAKADLSFNQDGLDLLIANSVTGAVTKVVNYFSPDIDPSLAKPLSFADGTQLTYGDVAGIIAGDTSLDIHSSKDLFSLVQVSSDQSGQLQLDFSGAENYLDSLLQSDPATALTHLTEFSLALKKFSKNVTVDFNAFREHYLAQSKDYGWAIDSAQNVVIHFDNNYGGYDAQPSTQRVISGDLTTQGYYWNSLAYGGTGHVQLNSMTSSGHFVGVGGDKDSNISAWTGSTDHGVDIYNVLDGGKADDTLVGGSATNFLDGHGGSDLLIGGTGANVYFVSAQNGSAVIRNTRGSQDTTVDKIQFDSDVSSSDATFYQKGNDLLISIADGPQTLVENYFAPADANGNLGAVAQLQFSDGTLITPADMADLLSVDDGSASHSLVAPQDDPGSVLTAWAEDTVLTAGSGADSLTGSRGNDTLIAGSGTAVMAGHGGSNSYVFSLTSGDSVIDNTAYAGTAIDSLHFTDGILPGGLAFSPKGKDLVLTIKATGRSVTIKDFYNTAYNGNLISSVVFGDGTTWTRDAFAAWLATASADNPVVHAMAGPVDPTYGTQKYSATAGSADATLYATPNSTNANTLIGGSGNTTFYGAAGQYTFIQEGTGDSEIFTHPNDGVQGKGFLAVRSGGVGNTVLHAQEGDGTIQMGNFTSAPGNRVVIELDNTIRPEDVSTYYGGYATDFSWGTGLTIEFAQLDTGHPATVMSNPWSDAAEVFRFDNGLIWDKSYLAQNHQKLASTDVAGDSVQLVANGAVDTIYAGSGNDTLTAQIDNAWLFGGSGSDTFFGQTNALFSGGSGHSQMNAGTGVTIADGGLGGADVYLNWSQASHAIIQVDNGGGNDNVWLSSGAASIRFGFGINRADIDFVPTQNSLKMVVRSTGQTIEVQNWFEPWVSHDVKIEFMDGTTLSYDQVADLLPANGGEGDVTIHAKEGVSLLQAGSGNDTLVSSNNGNETILGGTGNDTIVVQGSGHHVIDAGSGNTVVTINSYGDGQIFKFGHSSGQVDLQNYNWNSQKQDVLQLADDVTVGQVTVTLVPHYYPSGNLPGMPVAAPMAPMPPSYGGDLEITLDNGSSFTLDGALGQNAPWSAPIDAVKFADGTTWTFHDLLTRIETHPGVDGNSYLPSGANMAFADGSSSPLLGSGEKAGLFSYYAGSYIKDTADESIMEADKGYAILQGGAGVNYLTSQGGYYDNSTYQYYNQPSLMDGGVGTSTISGGDAVVLGNKGNSTQMLWGTHDVILFNKGDGNDIIQNAGQNGTLSFGGGLTWTDLSFSKVGQDLIISSGVSSGTIDIQNWFADWFAKDGFNLQMFTNLSDEAAGATPQAQLLHLQDAVSAFSAAMTDNPALQSWNLGSSLQNFALTNESGAVLGGDLAHYYAMEGSFSGMSVSAAQAVLADAQFGSAQVLHDISSLQQSSNKILS